MAPFKVSYERQNWTILHEIGHIVLDHRGHSEHEEDEADFFAKYSIAPPVLVYKIGAESQYDIYTAFDISMEAAQYAFDYYRCWRSRFRRLGHLTAYEEEMVSLYEATA